MKWPVKPIRYLGVYIGYDTEECYKLNFDDKIGQIENVLKQAGRRTLTLFGKVCIIKSLALAKIIYVSSCLAVPDKVIKQIDQQIFRFLWGKRDRIKRKSIINKVEEGGLDMIDVRSQLNAIKAAWVGRIMSAPHDHLWSFLPKSYFSKFGKDYFLLKTTVMYKTMFLPLGTIPEFYQDVVIAYNTSKQFTHEDFLRNIKSQPIWGNRFIQFKNKTLFFKSWVTSGLLSIANLKITNGKLDVDYLFYSVNDKRNFHSEINILQNALISANICICNEPSETYGIPVYVHFNNEMYEWSCTSIKSKYYYRHIIERVKARPTSERYWLGNVNEHVSEDIISESYQARIKMIKDMKLAETNFKILNNILPCNRNLFKWGKTDTNLCCFCQEEESISHLLFYCPYVKSIWCLVSRILFDGEPISHNMVIFGSGLTMPLNYILSSIVYFIYKDWLICSLENKKRKQNICFKYFRFYLIGRMNVYSKCKEHVWQEVCCLLNDLICELEHY